MEILIKEIQIYEERQPDGQWLKSITFRLPIIEEDIQIPVGDGLDNDGYVETWELIPPHEPRSYLFAFVARIVRHMGSHKIR